MTTFYKDLHELAIELAEAYTFDGDEGEPGYSFKYSGLVESNYPWVYIQFKMSGRVSLYTINKLEEDFKEFCEQPGATYLSTTIGGQNIKFRLFYREDLAKNKEPPSNPDGSTDTSKNS